MPEPRPGNIAAFNRNAALVDRLRVLIRTAENWFHMPDGALLAQDRSQPVVSFRQLAMIVAADAGYSQAAIARAFERDKVSVYSNIKKGRECQRKGYSWWGYAKADLVDAWHDAVEEALRG